LKASIVCHDATLFRSRVPARKVQHSPGCEPGSHKCQSILAYRHTPETEPGQEDNQEGEPAHLSATACGDLSESRRESNHSDITRSEQHTAELQSRENL